MADGHRATDGGRRSPRPLDLRLGNAAGTIAAGAYRWFTGACAVLNVRPGDVALQWNTLAKVTALTGVAPDRVGAAEFEHTRRAIVDAYLGRGLPSSGRNIASVFRRLRLTLFHAGRLDSATHRRHDRRYRSPAGPPPRRRSPRPRSATSPRSR